MSCNPEQVGLLFFNGRFNLVRPPDYQASGPKLLVVNGNYEPLSGIEVVLTTDSAPLYPELNPRAIEIKEKTVGSRFLLKTCGGFVDENLADVDNPNGAFGWSLNVIHKKVSLPILKILGIDPEALNIADREGSFLRSLLMNFRKRPKKVRVEGSVEITDPDFYPSLRPHLIYTPRHHLP